MKHKIILPGIFVLCLFVSFLWHSSLLAQEENLKTDPLTLFSNQKRPAPEFDHVLHEDSLGDTGCAKCHHVLDTEQNKLVYSEGEEMTCSECHASEPAENLLAVREASHQSCTGCHREMKKEKKTAGPTTCGECHKK